MPVAGATAVDAFGRTRCYTATCLRSPRHALSRRAGLAKLPRRRALGTRSCGLRFWRSCRARLTIWAGGVFKKRLNDNMHRAIVLAKGGHYWVFAYLFAKKDRANIDRDELADFKKLAQAYGRMTEGELASALSQGDLQELFP